MKEFNERAVLVRSLVAIFAVQLGIAGYQMFSCKNTLLTTKTNPEFVQYCSKSNENFMETGKSMTNVILALLVPAAAAAVVASNKRRPKKEPQNLNNLEDKG